jgi:hypothetical protein
VRATAKYSLSSSRTASGSLASDSGVNPTRSQNKTEQVRRSATGRATGTAPAGPAAEPLEGGGSPVNAAPQAWQNR